MYSCVHTTSPSLSTEVGAGPRPSPVRYFTSSRLRKSNESLRGGNETSNFPETPPGATDVGPSKEPGPDAESGDGDEAEDRSGLREHPPTRISAQDRSIRWRDMNFLRPQSWSRPQP